MCLIFDRFQNREQAERFAASVKATFGLKTDVYDTQAESEGLYGGSQPEPDGKLKDLFPSKLHGPIVLIERTDDQSNEPTISSSVEKFGGVFAGT